MDIIAATTPDPSSPSEQGSVNQGAAGLSVLQRDFARHFVLCGGKARRAAILAGYSAASSSISAHRNLVNPKVLAEIKRIAVSNVQAALPIAIRTLIDVCMNSTDPKARVMAANSLLDRGGIAAPKGGVHVNVGVQVNGQQVQALIGQVWEAKQRRLSDIPAPMSDSPPLIETERTDALGPTFDDEAAGGVQDWRVPSGSSFIPPPIDTEHAILGRGRDDGERGILEPDEGVEFGSEVGGERSAVSDEDALAEWRAATGGARAGAGADERDPD